jgi:predicted aspartyl protease
MSCPNLHQYAKRQFGLLLLFFLILISTDSYADQSFYYYIDQDENGYFIQTENDGRYYFDTEFSHNTDRIGQNGEYKLETFDHGTYLITSRHGKFLIDSTMIENDQKSLDPSVSKKTKIIVSGHHVLVPVKISAGSKTVETFLLLDTGATIVALHLDLAKKLKIRPFKKSMIQVVGGETIEVDVGILSSIKLGPIEKKNISVCIINSPYGSKSYDGLLGMNFLNNVNYRIDFKKQLLIWD